MFKRIAPPSLSISGHLKEIMRMKSWLTCWKEQVDTVNCLSNIWIKKSRSVGTNCCGVSALVLQLWLLSRFSCLAQMLDPDSYYQNGHELMKEKLIASSLVLQDKGFIAMSKDSVTPSPMTQNKLLSLDSHTYPELLYDGEWSKGSIQRSPVWSWESQERSFWITYIRPQARGAANVPSMTKAHNTPLAMFAWRPFCGGVIKGSNWGVQGKPAVQENPEGKGTGYTGMRTMRVHERTRTKRSWNWNAWLEDAVIPT